MVDTIVGIDSPNYTPDTADVAANIYCRVTATNASGSSNAISNVVGPVTAAAPSGFTYIADTEGQHNDSIVTSAIDTTGADLLIVATATYTGDAVITDSKGNSWTGLLQPSSGAVIEQLFYSYPTSVGTGHTVTVTSPVPPIYAAACFAAFSGGAAGTFDDAVYGVTGSGSPATNGSITPAQDNSLIISVIAIDDAQSAAMTVDSSFTKICDLDRTSQFGLAVGYLIQGTAAAVNPSWTLPGAGSWAGTNAVFSSVPLALTRPT